MIACEEQVFCSKIVREVERMNDEKFREQFGLKGEFLSSAVKFLMRVGYGRGPLEDVLSRGESAVKERFVAGNIEESVSTRQAVDFVRGKIGLPRSR